MFFGITSYLLEDLETSKQTAHANKEKENFCDAREGFLEKWSLLAKKHLFLLFHSCFQNFSPIAWKGINCHTETMTAPNLTQITDT